MAVMDTLVTLHPAGADFRPDAPGLPISTKANYDVWNENEVKLSGAYQCVTCWDSALLSRYPGPNHFLVDGLHTDIGKARIDGIASGMCSPHEALPTALIGIAAKLIAPGIRTGHNLFDVGTEGGVVHYDVHDPPPGAHEGLEGRVLP